MERIASLRTDSEDVEDDDDSESGEERTRVRMSFVMLCFIPLMRSPVTIAAMESQIEAMCDSTLDGQMLERVIETIHA